MSASKPLHRFAKFTTAATLFLIVAGGLVTSTGSGLAVPDWPLSFGGFFPPMTGGVFYEHGHRMTAAAVACLTLVLMIWLLKAEPRAWVRRLGVVAMFAVLAQAALGGVTVLLKLPIQVSVAHACLAQVFFCLVVVVALATGKSWTHPAGRLEAASGPRLDTLAWTLFGAIFLQLVLGSTVRHMGAGLAIPDFPLSYGMWIPPLTAKTVQVHFAHRVGALVILLLVAWVVVKAVREYHAEPLIARPALCLGGLVLLQIALGAFTIWSMKSVPLVTAHVAVGALVLASALVLALRATRLLMPSTGRRRAWKDYLALTKPRLTVMVLFTTAVGFLIASGGDIRGGLFFWTLIGTLSVAAGSQTLNQYLEREIDARMGRTCARPLPSGRLRPYQALRFGVILSGAGLVALSSFANGLAGLIAFVTLASYLFAYTPLKKKTSLCTLVGAIPGALPPMIGWAAVEGGLGLGAWALFAILFIWQIPHFLSLSWIYRSEYRDAGLAMLSVSDPDGRSTKHLVLLWTLALVPVSLVPTFLGLSGGAYFVGALVLGLFFLGTSLRLVRWVTPSSARTVFLSSVIYLPLLLILMLVDRAHSFNGL